MILLIGGTGYVGLKFQEILSQRNIEFKNLSRSEILRGEMPWQEFSLELDKIKKVIILIEDELVKLESNHIYTINNIFCKIEKLECKKYLFICPNKQLEEKKYIDYIPYEIRKIFSNILCCFDKCYLNCEHTFKTLNHNKILSSNIEKLDKTINVFDKIKKDLR